MEEAGSTQLVLASEIALPKSPVGARYLVPTADQFQCVRPMNLHFPSKHTRRAAAFARSRSARETFAAHVFLADR